MLIAPGAERNRGICAHSNRNQKSIVGAGIDPELETNTDVQAMWKHYDARQHKRRRAFIKEL